MCVIGVGLCIFFSHLLLIFTVISRLKKENGPFSSTGTLREYRLEVVQLSAGIRRGHRKM